jgi:hypothetical protein
MYVDNELCSFFFLDAFLDAEFGRFWILPFFIGEFSDHYQIKQKITTYTSQIDHVLGANIGVEKRFARCCQTGVSNW